MGHICLDAEEALLLLLVKFGGLELKNLFEIANIEQVHSKEITRELYKNVVKQNKDFQVDSQKKGTIKNKLKPRKISNYESKLEEM